jgi:CheY-like chemotaxis protein/HPt (histidine-containing phosphotransfer) domain-containing protein
VDNLEDFEKLRGAKVLVVEDIEINQQVVGELLERAGVVVSFANNGEEAVAAVKNDSFDGILMDVQMPVMDGYEATRQIRQLEGAAHSIPIIATTAHALPEHTAKCLEVGMDDHIRKPIDPAQLYSVLAKWVKPAETAGVGAKARAVAASAQNAPSSDLLPESLPGIDIRDGLGRVGGNSRLYRSILLKLRSDFADASGKIHHLLQTGQLDEATRIAHSLKGVAGNVGAADLHAAAAAVESALRQGHQDKAAEALKELDAAIGTVMVGLSSIVDDATADSGDTDLTQESLKGLPDALLDQMRSATARADLDHLEKLLGEVTAVDAPLAKALGRVIEDLDYALLRKLLDM